MAKVPSDKLKNTESVRSEKKSAVASDSATRAASAKVPHGTVTGELDEAALDQVSGGAVFKVANHR